MLPKKTGLSALLDSFPTPHQIFENYAVRAAPLTMSVVGLRRRRRWTIWNARVDDTTSHCLRVLSLCGRSLSLQSVVSVSVKFSKIWASQSRDEFVWECCFRLSPEFCARFQPILQQTSDTHQV